MKYKIHENKILRLIYSLVLDIRDYWKGKYFHWLFFRML